MKHLFFAFVLVFVGMVGWRIGGSLSSDAMGMAIGMLFGIMAGIPTALLILASQRRSDHYSEREQRPQRLQIVAQPPALPTVPHVTNNYITNNHYHVAPGQRDRRAEVEARNMLSGPMPETPAPRQFRVVQGADGTDEW